MAISPYPTPSDAGVLCVILANTAISISIVKEILRSILHVMGIHMASHEEFSTDSSGCRRSPSETYMEQFSSLTPSMRYDPIFICGQECSICLSEFDRTAEINRLRCGHFFHNSCLTKWFNYWNTTCPLCRNHMMPQEMEEEDECPM